MTLNAFATQPSGRTSSLDAVPGAVPAAGTRRRGAVPVLLVVRELGFGGIERDVAKLALGFDRTRYIPYVATYKPSGPRYDELHAAGIPILPLQFPSLVSTEALSAAFKFAAFVKRHAIQLVHAFDPSSVFAVPLARALRVPIVLSSQLGHRWLHDGRTRNQLKFVDRWSDAVVVNCESLRQHLTSDYQVPHHRIELCYNGVQTRDFYPGPSTEPAGIAESEFVIGAVSVLRAEKALHELQEAFARVRHLIPGAKLLIVGDGPELGRLQQNRDRLNLQSDCVLLPALSAVAPVLRSMDVFVSCSHSEAFSNALLEAMACGCCVIGSRVGGTPELIGENERGLLFEVGNVEDLASKLASVMENTPLRTSLSSAAALYALTHLTVEKNVERTMQIYDLLFERKRGPLHV